MKCLIKFGNECEVYPRSNVVTIRSMEKCFEDHQHKLICEMPVTDSTTATLMILDDDSRVIKTYNFAEAVKTEKNLIVFVGHETRDGVYRLITLAVRDTPTHTPDSPPLIELMTDNLIDNICYIARGKKAYIEITY